jgi:heptosyltransferase-2
MRILINALSGIGDAVMFSPALKVLRDYLPGSRIEMMVMFKAVKEIYDRNPAVNKVHFIDFLNQSAFKSFKDVISFRKFRYDASINVYPSNRREYNIINFLIGAELKIGTRYLNYSFSNFHFLNNRLAKEVKNKHNVLENYELVKFIVPNSNENDLGDYDIYLNDGDREFANNYIQSNNLSKTFLVGFHAGSATFKRHINKRWSADKFAGLAHRLNKQYGAKILLFGTEKDVNEYIFNQCRDIALIPEESSIMESVALMKKCSLFVANDAALMHIASALQIPTAAIFAYTNYNELRPWKSKHIIVRKELPCSPCFFNSPRPVKCIYSGEDEFKCIKTISVDEVFEACKELLNPR